MLDGAILLLGNAGALWMLVAGTLMFVVNCTFPLVLTVAPLYGVP